MGRGVGITLELQGLDFFQVTILAVLQGATEFLPVSSSGHLILPSLLFAWDDQGLTFDVAVHVGTLFAVLIYFRDELQRLVFALILSVFQRKNSEDSKLAWMLLAATIPAGLSGLLLASQVEQYSRSLILIGVTSIGFGLLLFVSDRFGSKQRTLADMNWKTALLMLLSSTRTNPWHFSLRCNNDCRAFFAILIGPPPYASLFCSRYRLLQPRDC